HDADPGFQRLRILAVFELQPEGADRALHPLPRLPGPREDALPARAGQLVHPGGKNEAARRRGVGLERDRDRALGLRIDAPDDDVAVAARRAGHRPADRANVHRRRVAADATRLEDHLSLPLPMPPTAIPNSLDPV